MSNWKRYFKVTDKAPARLVVRTRTVVDFNSDKNDEKLMLEIWEGNLPYLEITEEGKRHFLGIKPENESKPRKGKNKKQL
jgi:hypothetical protein